MITVHEYIHNAYIHKFQFVFMCWQGFVYNHKLFIMVPLNIHNTKTQRTIDLQKGISLKSLHLMFQRIIFSSQYETEWLNLTAQFRVVFVAPLAG